MDNTLKRSLIALFSLCSSDEGLGEKCLGSRGKMNFNFANVSALASLTLCVVVATVSALASLALALCVVGATVSALASLALCVMGTTVSALALCVMCDGHHPPPRPLDPTAARFGSSFP